MAAVTTPTTSVQGQGVCTFQPVQPGTAAMTSGDSITAYPYTITATPAVGWRFDHFEVTGVYVLEPAGGQAFSETLALPSPWNMPTAAAIAANVSEIANIVPGYWIGEGVTRYGYNAYYTAFDVKAVFVRATTHLLVRSDAGVLVRSDTGVLVRDD